MTRAFYLDGGDEPVFAMFDEPPPSAPAGRTAVLFCPPIGWADVCSYRPRRDWAIELAGAGHPTLRIDLPGSGDSGGGPRDPERFEAWIAAITAAAGWLRDTAGRPRLAALGIALGAPALYTAIVRGAPVDDLVLWGATAHGRRLVREQRAVARLEQAQQPSTEPAVVPDGAVMTAGYLLSAETATQLERFDAETLPPPSRVSRALLLERDGIAVDERLAAVLRSAGAEVTTAAGDGFAAMLTVEPQDAELPREVQSTLNDWLEADRSVSRLPATAPPEPVAAVAAADFRAPDGGRIRESPVWFETPNGRLFGILCEPVGPRTEVCLVLLNAGAQRRIGVNRMWVEVARRWAARGVPSLRIDLQSIGDAEGPSHRYTDLNSFYVPEFVDRVREVLDALQRRGLPGRFVLLGLCSGAYWSLHAALADQRISTSLMLNTKVLVWDPELLDRRDSERLRRSAFKAGAWRRILHGETSRSRLWAGARAAARNLVTAPWRLLTALRARASRRGGDDQLDQLFDALRDRGQRGVLLFTADEPAYAELERDGQLDRLDRWPNLTLLADERLRSGNEGDHTLRPLWLQQYVHELLDATLAREIGAGVPTSAAAAEPSSVDEPTSRSSV